MEMTIAWRRMQKARGHCLQRREATLRQLRLRSIQSLSLSLSLSLSRVSVFHSPLFRINDLVRLGLTFDT